MIQPMENARPHDDIETLPGAAIIGAGPAGLAAAEALAGAGHAVTLFDQMPSMGRKFLMAGKSGLNITHSEPVDLFLTRFAPADDTLLRAIRGFDNSAIIDWMHALGTQSFTGSSGRVFPITMKASPLLRAWLGALGARGVHHRTSWRWTGFGPGDPARHTAAPRPDGPAGTGGTLTFDTPGGTRTIRAGAIVFACGGKSWPRLGSDGLWADYFRAATLPVEPFRPSNCGFTVNWSAVMADHAGAPIKPARITAPDGISVRGECVISRHGIEGGAIYTLSRALRTAIEQSGAAMAEIDLAPDWTTDDLAQKLHAAMTQGRKRPSFGNVLRRVLNFDAARRALFFEVAPTDARDNPARAAASLKSLSLRLTAPFPMAGAISTAGGVAFSALDERLMLRARPGYFCAGEMLAFDAPTGGYLLTAALATGRLAGMGASDWLTAGKRNVIRTQAAH